MARGPQGNSKADLARAAWRDLFDFVVATVGQRNRVLSDLGLTPNDSRALGSLDPDTGRTMRSLADEWRCDASTVTWIVDRLEKKALAERRPHPSDRRARIVALTPLGARTRAELVAGTYAPPPELLELDWAELTMLCEAVSNLPTARRPTRRRR